MLFHKRLPKAYAILCVGEFFNTKTLLNIELLLILALSLYTHSGETVHGKVFCAFLSLIILSEMLNGLSGYMREQKLTFRKIVLELGKVKCDVSKSGLWKLFYPPSQTVSGISDLLGIPQDSVSRFV